VRWPWQERNELVVDIDDGSLARDLEVQQVPTKKSRVRGPLLMIRSHVAATISRLTAGWTTVPESAESVTYNDLTSLRARSRERKKNDPLARRIGTLFENNVLGAQGVQYQAQVLEDDRPADAPPQVDTKANQAIETSWKSWGRPENCDASGRANFAEMQRQALSSVIFDGEILVRFLFGFDNPWRFAIMLHDAEMMDHKLVEKAPNGNWIKQGVEVDQWNRPVAYWIKDYKGPRSNGLEIVNRHVRIPALGQPNGQMLHVFKSDQVGAVRGLPWLSNGLQTMKMLDGYLEAALAAARVGASQVLFFEKDPGAQGFRGDEEDPETGDQTINLEPGEANELPAGVRISDWSPKYPHGEMPEFVKVMHRRVGMSAGLSYTSVANDTGDSNFAGARQGLIEERATYKSVQGWWISSFCEPIATAWLKQALLSRQILHPLTKRPLPADRIDKFSAHRWAAPRWDWVDPLKDAQAKRLLLEIGATTESAIIRELGLQPDDVLDERQREIEERRKRQIRTTVDVALEQNEGGAPAPEQEGDASE
jgi:lambda family phage portal protein